MSAVIQQQVKVPVSTAGQRLDQAAVDLFPDFSRSRLQNWIKSGNLRLDDRHVKPKTKLGGGEILTLDAELESNEAWVAEEIPLQVVFEDDELLVLNKPAGLVVHPGAGNWRGTLLNALLFKDAAFASLPRAGIVHRLDKETSGLMVVAKSLSAQASLVQQLQERTVSRRYWAIVVGELREPGVIDAPIGRHPTQRTKMAVVSSGGKAARTHYTVLQALDFCTLVELKLETGRTHQIRVHMAHLGFPLIGDPVYGRSTLPSDLSQIKQVQYFQRQALHAKYLGLMHPQTLQQMEWGSLLPIDMQDVLLALGGNLQ